MTYSILAISPFVLTVVTPFPKEWNTEITAAVRKCHYHGVNYLLGNVIINTFFRLSNSFQLCSQIIREPQTFTQWIHQHLFPPHPCGNPFGLRHLILWNALAQIYKRLKSRCLGFWLFLFGGCFMPGHIGNLSHHSESFLAHCTHCEPSGLYWYCIADCRQFCSKYFLRVLLPSYYAKSLFNNGLSSFSWLFHYLKEMTYIFLPR